MIDALYWGPASQRQPRQLVVLCHGIGADAHDLFDLAQDWGEAAPDALFASVNAPEVHYSGFGRRWWAVGDRRPEVMETGVRRAQAALDGFLDAELARLGLPADAYALMGFSQGAMTVLFTGLRRAVGPRAILAFSGALLVPESLPGEIRNHAPVLLVHGEVDEAVPVSRSREAEKVLQQAGVPVESTYIPGLGHGIDDTGIAMGGLVLRRSFGNAA